ncbi:MAG: GTP cyclohydrolase I [Kiritimatiellaeota bacterium]|nr:GTP cyclohydrolase I [Kiritimatiellota bacterium]
MRKINKERVAELTRELLAELGEDPAREGLKGTPGCVAEALAFLTGGYGGCTYGVALCSHPQGL